MRARVLGYSTAGVLAAASLSLVQAGPAHAGEPVCIPFNGPTTVVVFDKEYTVPGHSLPCQSLP